MATKARDLHAAGAGILGGARVSDDELTAVAPVPTTGAKVRVSGYVDPPLARALGDLAARLDRSMSWIVTDALRQYVSRTGTD